METASATIYVINIQGTSALCINFMLFQATYVPIMLGAVTIIIGIIIAFRP